MIAPLARVVDWSVLQFWWALRLKSVRKWNLDAAKLRLEEALDFLNGPDFMPLESQPAQLEFNDPVNFRFPTPGPCDSEANNLVPGRFYRCVGRWQERPVVILLHGGGDFLNYRFRFPWIASGCNWAGYNAATLVAPHHFQRRSRGRLEWDYLRTAKAFAQSVAEIRALAGWCLAQGCPSVSLWGISLGGWQAGLAACCDTRLASVVLSVPGVRPKQESAAVWRRVQETLRIQAPAREALNLTPLNLTRVRPVIPKENILLMSANQDLFVGTKDIEKLWQNWGQPEIWRMPHGHISWMGVPGTTNRVLLWLQSRPVRPAAPAG